MIYIRVSIPWVIISCTWSSENSDQKRVATSHDDYAKFLNIECILFNLCDYFIYKSIRYGDIVHVALDWWYHSWCIPPLRSDCHTTVPDPWKSRIRNESLLLPSVSTSIIECFNLIFGISQWDKSIKYKYRGARFRSHFFIILSWSCGVLSLCCCDFVFLEHIASSPASLSGPWCIPKTDALTYMPILQRHCVLRRSVACLL